jgi:hypothetical protein
MATLGVPLHRTQLNGVLLGGLRVAQVIGLGIAVLGLLWLARLGLGRTATSQRSEVLS